MWPGEPFSTGKVIEMNERRAVVVGVYRASQTFMTVPIIYTRFSQATLFVPPTPTGRLMPFVLAKAQPGADPDRTGSPHQSADRAEGADQPGIHRADDDVLPEHTGIPVNFGTTVLLAFLVGCAIAGQTFYLFTVENLKQFGTLKAMGMSDRRDRRHDPDAGDGGRRHRLWRGRRPGDAVRHLRPASDAAAGLLPALAGAGADGGRRDGHRAGRPAC